MVTLALHCAQGSTGVPSCCCPSTRLAAARGMPVHTLPAAHPSWLRAGDVAIASNGWPEVVVWTPWTAMEACYR